MAQHPEFAGKTVFFERKKKEYLKRKKNFYKAISVKKSLKAVCLLVLRVVRAKKTHPIAKKLILTGTINVPCEVDYLD